MEIDGVSVDQYNLAWLREHIGVVSQEPILFHTTIKENILFGRTDASQEQIEQAAKMANVHDFIMQLPEKYDTLVGERGAQMSGVREIFIVFIFLTSFILGSKTTNR